MRGPTKLWAASRATERLFRNSGTWRCVARCWLRSDGDASAVTKWRNGCVLLELPIKTDAEPNLVAAFALARRRRLSFYDAVYLELALRCGGALATLDAALARAGIAEGLALVEP